MIQRIGASFVTPSYLKNVQNTNVQAQQNTTTSPVKTTPAFNYTATQLVNAYQAFHGIVPAKTVSFGHLSHSLNDLRADVYTCQDKKANRDGEKVGQRWLLTPLTGINYGFVPGDKQITNFVLEDNKKDKTRTVADASFERTAFGYDEFNIQSDKFSSFPSKHLYRQVYDIKWTKNLDDASAYLMETKGALTAVIDDKANNNVLITNNGLITPKGSEGIAVKATSNKPEAPTPYITFTAPAKEIDNTVTGPSIGKGTEIVIGMEEGRFVPEIIKSIEDFTKKVESGEIVLPQFVAAKNAQSTQLAMLAGGFGSRAEYTNAASEGILNSQTNPDGAQTTKGTFRTATGLTPMETTFVSLHKAGLLDCSKGNLKIGDNIKFYLNQSGVNKGNGGFTVDLYEKMAREGRESLVILPNDSMSRMPVAAAKMAEIMNSGDAAIAMIAKKVPAKVAAGTFGIMKLDENNQILEFAEKPKEIPDGYADSEDMCLTNTFQFAVSKEAFEALDILKDEFKALDGGKESRDWSKFFVPVLMSLTQSDGAIEAREKLVEALGKGCANIDLGLISQAKDILGNQKIYAVPTDESWADVGSMGEMYKTTMEIAKGNFKLEPFERNNVLDCVNTETGLVATTKADKEKTESKYDIMGSVMVVPKAEKVDPSILDNYIADGLVTINPKQVK